RYRIAGQRKQGLKAELGNLIGYACLTSERPLAPVISRFGIVADQNVLARAGGFRASHLRGGAPDQLGIMADIRDPAGGAVVGEYAGAEKLLFANPGAYHGFRSEIALGAGPKILALGCAVIFRRMFEAAGGGQIVGPLLCGARERRIPAQR